MFLVQQQQQSLHDRVEIMFSQKGQENKLLIQSTFRVSRIAPTMLDLYFKNQRHRKTQSNTRKINSRTLSSTEITNRRTILRILLLFHNVSLNVQ